MRQSAASFGWFVLVRPMSSTILPDQHTRISIPTIIALVGAGGKTSLLFWLSLYFKKLGLKVLCTTTTAMHRPDPSQYDHLVIHHEFTQLLTVLNQSPKATVTYCATSYTASTGKVKGLSPNDVNRIGAHHIFDVILVEADGAKGLPIKAPDDHEPCIPDTASVVVAVVGVEILFQPAKPDQIHRWASFSALTQCEAHHTIDTSTMLALIGEPDGLFKRTPCQSHRVMAFNKLDLPHATIPLKALAQKLLVSRLCHSVWLTSTYFPALNHYHF